MQRQPELHVSALSPAEFRAYTRYLDLIALTAARDSSSPSALDADGMVRFAQPVVREFCVERLGVPRGIVEDVLTSLLPGAPRLTAGNVYAVLRLLAHIMPSSSGNRSPRPKALDPDFVFVPIDPLPLDPDAPLPLAPPRRVASLHSKGSRSVSGPPIIAPKPSLPPRRPVSPPFPSSQSPHSVPSSAPPSPPSRNAPFRKSLPAAHSMDPFRDNPSPGNSPVKSRTLSAGAGGSNNPFRNSAASSASPLPDTPPFPVSAPPTVTTHAVKVGPPLPPRKPSVRRPTPSAPSLPPRQPSRSRGDSVGSSSTPTSTSQPSTIMQQSFAAAAAGEMSRRKEDTVFQVIRSSSPAPSVPTPPLAPVPGRRDIIDTVTRAIRECEVDPPPPPPQRVASISRPKSLPPGTRTNSSSGFIAAVEKYRPKHPGLKTWTTGPLLSDRPHRQAYAMIIVNQPITRRDTLLRAWSACTLRFCADGGANRLHDVLDPEERAQMLPTMIKGDLDSIRPEVRGFYVSKGVALKRDPSEYATDLMKCIEEIESIEASSGKTFTLLIFGGLSGRLDQTAHTMSIMHKLRTTRRETLVMSEDSIAWVLDKGPHLIEIDHATMGQTCGILPLGVSESFVRTEGLKWNLDWVTSLDGAVSTSNHLLPSEPAVLVETSAPVFWTMEIREDLPPFHPARTPLSPADELSRGVKELGAGFVRAAGGVAVVGKGLTRRLSRQGLPGQVGGSSLANGEMLKDRERIWERERRERTGLVGAAAAQPTVDTSSEDEHGDQFQRQVASGYSLLD